MAKGKGPKIYPWKHTFNSYSRPPPSVQEDLSPKLYSCEDEDVKYIWKMYQSFFVLSSSFSKEWQQSNLVEAFAASSPSLWYNFISSALLSSTLSIWLRPNLLTVKRELCTACNQQGDLCCETLRHQHSQVLKHADFSCKRYMHRYSCTHKHSYIYNFFR